MKTKPKNFRKFLCSNRRRLPRILAAEMGAFSLLLGQQRAELMAAEIKDSRIGYRRLCKVLLDSTEHEENDPTELRRMLKEQSYQRNCV